MRHALLLVFALTAAIPGAVAHHEKAAFATDALALDLADVQIPERDHVILLHGYDGSGMEPKAPKSDWAYIRQLFDELGWSSGGKWVGYYGSENGDVNMHDHGSHDKVAGGSDAHGGPGHDRYTPIQHLGHHFAWTVYEGWNKQGICPSVLAHSMGGLIARAALTLYEEGNEAAPPELCIRTVVTMGTPHRGHMWEHCITTQCKQMQPGSAFLGWLATNMHPDGDAPTYWAAMGSHVDGLVASPSSVALDVDAAVIYTKAADVHHSTFFGEPTYFDARTTDDDAPALVWTGTSFLETTTYWPARWADLALQLGAWSCGTRDSPAALEAKTWVMANLEDCRYAVKVPLGTTQLALLLANPAGTNASFLVKEPGGAYVECPHRGETTLVCVVDRPASGEWTVAVLESRSRMKGANWESFAFAYVARPNTAPFITSTICSQDGRDTEVLVCYATIEDDGTSVTTTARLTQSGSGFTPISRQTGPPGPQTFTFDNVQAGTYLVTFTAVDGENAALQDESSMTVVMKPKEQPPKAPPPQAPPPQAPPPQAPPPQAPPPQAPPPGPVLPPSSTEFWQATAPTAAPPSAPVAWKPIQASAPAEQEDERGVWAWIGAHPAQSVLIALGLLLAFAWMKN